ncbi:MAG: anti-sigma factor family protein [Burkholderiales bacterium]
MKENHIIKLLEESPLGDLSAADLEAIRSHTAHCVECRRAYEASQASSMLLRSRASVVVEPPPFFQTRVMAAIREKGLGPEPFGLLKMWLAARTLVASLAMLVVMLGTLTLFTGGDQTQTQTGADVNDDLAQWAVYERDDAEMTYSQLLTDIYDLDAEMDAEKR